MKVWYVRGEPAYTLLLASDPTMSRGNFKISSQPFPIAVVHSKAFLVSILVSSLFCRFIFATNQFTPTLFSHELPNDLSALAPFTLSLWTRLVALFGLLNHFKRYLSLMSNVFFWTNTQATPLFIIGDPHNQNWKSFVGVDQTPFSQMFLSRK